jgi:hypothetical protein
MLLVTKMWVRVTALPSLLTEYMWMSVKGDDDEEAAVVEDEASGCRMTKMYIWGQCCNYLKNRLKIWRFQSKYCYPYPM